MISVKLQEKTKETQSICFREQLSLHRKYTVYKRAFLSASKWKMLSNIPFFPFLNGCLFRVPFMHSLRKASQINKRCYMSSIYKQTPSRNLNCSVICFPLLHSSRQTADSQPSFAFSRRDWTKKSQGPNCSKDLLQILQGQRTSKPVTFALKLRRVTMNTKSMPEGWERMTTEERHIFLQPLERFWKEEKGDLNYEEYLWRERTELVFH